MDSEKSYSYKGPITMREGIQMESGDELYLSSSESWATAEHLCGAVARALGLERDGATANVRISIEVTG